MTNNEEKIHYIAKKSTQNSQLILIEKISYVGIIFPHIFHFKVGL